MPHRVSDGHRIPQDRCGRLPYEQAWSWGLLGWAAPLVSMIFSDHQAAEHPYPGESWGPGRCYQSPEAASSTRLSLEDWSSGVTDPQGKE